MKTRLFRIKAARTTILIALACATFGSVMGCHRRAHPPQVTMTTIKDNTLYEDVAGALSNGAGDHMFTGRTGGGSTVRALVAFDVAGIVPAGATITAVLLSLNMSRVSAPSARTVGLHRVLADWGEGVADAPGGEGGGAPASAGDATWLHTFFPGSFWSSPGGDFEGALSALKWRLSSTVSMTSWPPSSPSTPGLEERKPATGRRCSIACIRGGRSGKD